MSEVLSVRDVTVRFGGVTAVEDVSLTIQAGQLIGFIGPNGAGKTTLMRVITGIVRPQRGQVRLMGADMAGWPVDKRVRAGLALAQQIVQPLGSMSLVDNVALACGGEKTRRPLRALMRTGLEAEQARARELLDMVGIGEAAGARPATLPLGYLKRLEMARALALEPKLLLLDEPLAGLNQSEAEGLASLIRRLADRGQTILLIEHNLREVTRICPTLYVQDNGRPLAFGDAETVMADPKVRQAYLGAGLMLEVEGLTCGYGDIVAVRGLSLAVGRGEIFALIGANGAGKTSTLQCLAGLVSGSAERMSLGGTDIGALRARQRIRRGLAIVPEGRRVFGDLSVTENLTVGGHILDKAALARNRDRVFEQFPRLAERRHQLAGSLSGGEQQMLAIGRALMSEPRLLLVDELSLGLMPKVVDECYAVLAGLKQEGVAILLVEQNTERAMAAADRLCVLEAGQKVWGGTSKEARASSEIAAAYLGGA